MTRIRFEDLPSTNTPINAENLNKLNNVIVSSEEPTTGEEVWIDNVNKKIHTKNGNGYEEFYNEEEISELQNNVSNLINKTTAQGNTVNYATLYKIGNLVIVQGWFTINASTFEKDLPYKPATRTWVASIGLNTEAKASYMGMWELTTSGKLKGTFNGAVTYGTTGFCYYTND